VSDDPICTVCGLCYADDYPPDVQYHKKFHDEHVNGPKVKLPNGLQLVLPKSRLPYRTAAERAAILFKRELHFDFPSYVANSKDDFRDHRTIASIYVDAGRTVGLLVERDWECKHKIHLGDERYGDEQPETACRRLDVIWVLKSYRGKGIGKQLLRSFMDRNTDKPLAVQVPISDDGQRLLRAFQWTEFWIG
jgi:GNAT superfamily N-acetyltransferase